MSENLRVDLETSLEAGDQVGAVSTIKDPAELIKFGTLRDFIIAAREAGNSQALDIAEKAAGLVSRNKAQRYALAREFVSAERRAAAWTALIAGGDYRDDPGFAKQARRIYGRMPRGPLRREIMHTIARTVKTGSRRQYLKSAILFPAEGSKVYPMSTIKIEGSNATPARHLIGVQAHVGQYLDKLKRPFTPRIEELLDVFVDGQGQIWNAEGQVFKDTGKPRPTFSRDNIETIDIGFHSIKPTRGIYHWLVDRVPHLSSLSDPHAAQARLLLPESGPSFENDTLALADISQDRVTRVGAPIFVRRLLRPRVGFAGMRHWDRVSPIIEKIKRSATAIARQHKVEPCEHIYISRRDSKRRVMINEGEIEEGLAAQGYSVFAFGELPLWHQIFLASNASEIVSPHGAGLSHLIFAQPDVRITEIVPIRDGTYMLRLNYAVVSAVRGLKYSAWLEPQFAKGDSWETDPEAFMSFVRKSEVI